LTRGAEARAIASSKRLFDGTLLPSTAHNLPVVIRMNPAEGTLESPHYTNASHAIESENQLSLSRAKVAGLLLGPFRTTHEGHPEAVSINRS
jgi:hypothetical protein